MRGQKSTFKKKKGMEGEIPANIKWPRTESLTRPDQRMGSQKRASKKKEALRFQGWEKKPIKEKEEKEKPLGHRNKQG